MIIYTTKEMIKEFGVNETNSKIHRFKCKPEKIIENELKYRIVKSDMDRNTTTHFILIAIPRSSAAVGTRHSHANHIEHDSHEMPRSSAAIGSFTLDEKNNYKILAFFTLKFDRIEKSLLGDTILENESDDKFNSTYYIVFLARDDTVTGANKDNLRGKDILDAAIEQIDDARNKVGGVNIVLIDAYTSKEKVCKIYEDYGFTKIPAIGDKVNPMTHFFMKLSRSD